MRLIVPDFLRNFDKYANLAHLRNNALNKLDVREICIYRSTRDKSLFWPRAVLSFSLHPLTAPICFLHLSSALTFSSSSQISFAPPSCFSLSLVSPILSITRHQLTRKFLPYFFQYLPISSNNMKINEFNYFLHRNETLGVRGGCERELKEVRVFGKT